MKYWFSFSLIFLIIFGALISSWFYIFIIENREAINSEPLQVVIFFLISFLLFVFSLRSAFLILSKYFNYLPQKTQYHEVYVNKDYEKYENEISPLKEKAVGFKTALNEPDSLTLGTLKQMLDESLTISNKLFSYVESRLNEIKELTKRAESEHEKAKEATELAKVARGLSKKELQAVKLIITEDSKSEGKKWFFYGLLASIPVSFLSTLLYTYFLK